MLEQINEMAALKFESRHYEVAELRHILLITVRRINSYTLAK